MSDSTDPVKTIFLQAIEHHSPQEWPAFLDQACAGDAALRAGVEKLLRAQAEIGSFHEPPRSFAPTIDPAPIEPLGTMLGPYKLLQQIGEGGMGIVFMAEQTEPVRRKVAVKVIKPGMDSRQIIARFEAERQALALMDHVNIARVLDAGATQSGRPYFVMELVHGVPITTYCDDNRLTPRERLELFVPVCQAIQHAHQKGIIHRDIKPSNVMVTLYDGKPVAKIIDFGVAKATEQKLTERTLFTQYGTLVGTLEYMSPEQAEMSALGVDTRSDIYSLGVLLYELLTGSTPLTHKVTNYAYADILRMIREEEPPKPSTRLSDSGETLASISAQRKTEPAKLTKLIRGELDWIVLKALEKDRNRRYETASALATDVECYLRDEPVLACPPSKWYRFGKGARRHKVGMTLAGAVALAGFLALAGLTSSNAVIRQEQLRTSIEKTNAEQAQRLAEHRAVQIRRDLRNLTKTNALLERGRLYARESRWDDAYQAFTSANKLRPDQASIWSERGDLVALLGLWDLAAADFAQETELREPDVTQRYYLHALLRLRVGDTAGYQSLRRRARARFGRTNRTLFAGDLLRLCNLAADVDGAQQSVELGQNLLGDGSHGWLPLYSLGVAYYRAGQHDEAVRRLRESLDADPACVVRPLSYPVLAMAHHARGEIDLARQVLSEAAQALDRWAQSRYEARGRHSVVDRGAAATWPVAWWDWLECELFYAEAKRLIDGIPPSDDPRLRVLRARALAALQWSSQAGEQYDEALKQRPDDPQIRLEAHRNRGYGHAQAGRWSEAAVAFARAVETAPDESHLWRFRAVALSAAGEIDEYRELCAAMLDRFERTSDAWTACNVVFACVLGPDALPEMARLLRVAEVAAPYYHFGAYVRGAALYRAGRSTEAARSFEQAAQNYCPRAWEWFFLAMAQHRLGQLDEARHALAEGDRWIRDANRSASEDFSGTRPTWDGWSEKAVYPLLLRETKNVINAQ